MFALLTSIQSLLDGGGHIAVAIDGRCGSGKSTLAALLAERFGGRVVHMDDFFLPFELRDEQTFERIGGNIHTERLVREVMSHIRDTELCYNRYSCREGIYSPVSLHSSRLTVVEGSYSLLPELRQYYDLTVFCDVPREVQRRRIIAREQDRAGMFFERWIPLEERYFDRYAVRQYADIILNMEETPCSD